MKKRNIIRLASFGLAAFIILGGFTFSGYRQAATYKRYIENEYQYAFSELVTSIDALDSALQKGVYATSPSLMAALSGEVYMRAATAQASLSRLPFSDIELSRISSFLSQVGDFSYFLSKKSASQQALSEDELSSLSALSESASLLSYELSALQARINEGRIKFGDIEKAEEALSKKQDDVIPAGIGGTFKNIESEFPEFPHLIYDGPFSVHVDQAQAKQLLDKPDIDETEAKKKAAEFFGLDPSLLEYGGFSDGRIKTYVFDARIDGGEMSINITQAGGMILGMFNSRAVKTVKIGPEEAVTAAKEFLNSRGFTGMKETYWSIYGNTVSVNFAYEQDGVLCYPDLIRVSVAQDSGRIVGFESRGYIMNHESRNIPAPKIKLEDARAKVAAGLSILSENTVFIPTDGLYEILCYEFKCRTEDDRHYLLYVNAETGAEERILILLESDTGTLTI